MISRSDLPSGLVWVDCEVLNNIYRKGGESQLGGEGSDNQREGDEGTRGLLLGMAEFSFSCQFQNLYSY